MLQPAILGNKYSYSVIVSWMLERNHAVQRFEAGTMDPNQCRLCSGRSHLKNIFSLHPRVLERIHRFLHIVVSESDPLPKFICAFCGGRLAIIDEFYDNAKRNQAELWALLKNQPVSTHRRATSVAGSSKQQELQIKDEDEGSIIILSDDDDDDDACTGGALTSDDMESDSDIEFFPMEPYLFPKPMISSSSDGDNEGYESKPYYSSNGRLVQSQGVQTGNTLEEQWQVILQNKSKNPEFKSEDYVPWLKRIGQCMSYGQDKECQVETKVGLQSKSRFSWTPVQKARMKHYFCDHFEKYETPTPPEIAEFLLGMKDDTFQNVSATRITQFFRNRRHYYRARSTRVPLDMNFEFK